MEKTFSILTIGCKLNQFESEWIREALLRRNWLFRRFDEGARFCIIKSVELIARSRALQIRQLSGPGHANDDPLGCSCDRQKCDLTLRLRFFPGAHAGNKYIGITDSYPTGTSGPHFGCPPGPGNFTYCARDPPARCASSWLSRYAARTISSSGM